MKHAIALLLLSLVATAQARQDLTEEERAHAATLYRSPGLVRGTRITARWFEDGSTFWFRGPDGTVFVDPAEPLMRELSREERRAWDAERSRLRGGRIFTADFSRWAQVEDGDLWVHEEDREGLRLTEDAEEDVGWSATPDGWSPDGARLIAQRMDVRPVHHLPIIDYTHAEESVREVPYAKSGGAFADFELAVFDAVSGQKTVVELGPEEGAYPFIIGWTRDGAEALFLRLTRDGKRLELRAADPETGRSRVVLCDEQATFVGGLDFITGGWQRTLTLLEDGQRFLWLSERDGWRHVYLYSLDGTLIRRLTGGEFPVERVVDVDPERGLVFLMANAEPRLYDTHLYRVDLEGRGFQRLTQGEGEHAVQLSPSRRAFVDTWSNPAEPPVSELRDAEGRLLLELGRADASRLDAIGWEPPEEFVALADDGETELYGALYRPRDFDPERSYPVIDVIYAGPFTTMVPHSFAPQSFLALRARVLAHMGFVTFLVDCRGTTERGKAFQDASYGRIGQIEIPDHVAVLRQLAAERPWMDLDRVGIVGASWGGYFALRAMLIAPEVFRVGISLAPGDLTEAPPINEPYMGLRQDNPEGYAAGSNPPLAEKLEGHLLLIHGTADVNAPFSTTMRMVEALVRAGRRHDLAVLPQADHYFQGPSLPYVNELIISYFREHLAD